MKDYNTVVEHILQRHPDARDSDFRLFGWVCAVIKPDVMDLPFKQVMWKHKELELPSFETIRRTRQKLQHDKPMKKDRKSNLNIKKNLGGDIHE